MKDSVEILAELEAARGTWSPLEVARQERIEERKVLVLADAHIPYHDERLMATALAFAVEQKVEAVVWLGDLLDNPTFSNWGTDDPTTTAERECSIAETVLRKTRELGLRQYWTIGNHEMRWMRKNLGQFGMRRLANLVGVGDLIWSGDLIVSDNPGIEYGDDWLFTHPAQYSTQPLKVPGALADLHHKNVASAHAHHWARGMSPSGLYEVIETGCLINPFFVSYINKLPTTNRRWSQGYVLFDDGQARLIPAPRRG